MFLRELALDAVKQAGLAHGENVPADKYDEAVKNVIGALRYYSDCDTITCFTSYRHVTLGEETLVGLPALKRGIRLHFAGTEDNLPDLDGYDPETSDYVMDRDYWATDAGIVYGIRKSGDEYHFSECDIDDISTTSVDILVKDLGHIVSVFKDGDPLFETSLSKFFQFKDSVYVANRDGEGREKLYVKESGEYDIVYSRSFMFNENTKIDLPETQRLLVVAHAARLMCKTSERLQKLDGIVKECLNDSLANAADDVIPTRSF